MNENRFQAHSVPLFTEITLPTYFPCDESYSDIQEFEVLEVSLFLEDIKALYQLLRRTLKNFRDSEESRQSDRTAGFDLLPVSGRKSEGNHIFLGVAGLLA